MTEIDELRQEILTNPFLASFATRKREPFDQLVKEGLLVEEPRINGQYIFAPAFGNPERLGLRGKSE